MKKVASLLFALLIAAPSSATVGLMSFGYTPSVVTGWNVFKVGGGGQNTNIDYPTSASPFAITTDTAGAWIFNTISGTWVEVITSASMPAALTGDGNWLDGAYDFRSAPSDPTRCYLGYNIWNGDENTAHVLKSDNCNAADPTAVTFTDLTGFASACTPGCIWGPNNFSYKFIGPKIGIDPVNKNVVYVSTPHNGQFLSTDAGATWCAVPNITASAGSIPAVGIAFDPTSSTVATSLCGSSPTRTATVWQCTQGDGCWRSTNGGNAFTKQTSGTGPTNVGRAKIGIDGVYYATERDQTKLWRFTTTWTDITPAGGGAAAASVVVSPFTAANVAMMGAGGSMFWSTNANSGTPSWVGGTSAPIRAASDIPWFIVPASPATQDYLSLSDMVMDPVTAGKLWAASGIGVWFTASTTGQASYTGLSKGIEQLVVNKIISPPSGSPVMGAWDRASWYLNSATSYKSGYGPNYTTAIEMGWSVDYVASSPATIALLSNWIETDSAYSTDGGQTWHAYVNFPNIFATNPGGYIAASTADNVVFGASNKGDIYYSKNATNGAAVWTKILAATWGHGVQQGNGSVDPGWGLAFFANRQSLCADRVNAGTFYIFNSQTNALGGGFYRTTDQGDTWAQRNAQLSASADFGGFVNQLHCVPGKAGNIFYTGGQTGSKLYHSEDGGASWPSSATYTAITGAQGTPTNVYQVTTGAIKSGNDYPSVFIAGSVGGTYSIWRSDNTAAQWAAGSAITWTNLGLPLNSIDQISTMAGDNNTFGVLYIGGKGTTMFYYTP